MNNETSFWQRVNALIKKQNTTQNELSVSCGFNSRRIQNLSSGNRLPDAFEAVKIAQALDVSVEYLVTGTSTDDSVIKLDFVKKELENLLTKI